MDILPYLYIIILLVFSAFFSASEIAYNSFNRLRMKKSAESGSKTAKLTLSISDKFNYALSAILIGNNLANIAASSISTVIVFGILKSYGIESSSGAAVIATIVMTVIILIFGEIVPKILGKQNSDSVAKAVSFPVRILTIIFYPVTIIVMGLIKLFSFFWKTEKEDDSVSESELSTIIDTVEEEGVIDEEKSDLLQSALEFSDITVQEIITPRIDTIFIDIDDDPDVIEEIISRSHYSRIPVYEDSIDNIIGILYLNHYYKQRIETDSHDLRPLLMEPYYLHKTMKLPAALAEMRKRKIHLAIVVDEYGGTMGIVTMEDILEQIVGEIWDETDEIVDDYIQTGENSYDINGDMNIYDFFELVDVDDRDFESDYSTVGGWAIEMLEANPREGDSFSYKNLYIIITEMDDLRVKKLSVVINPVEDEDDY
ncbi:hypothetical protein SDC9_93253 [bioreactor metagenome]|uniref:Magnesium and cobalt efflux protein CorC n=1 Tax=bioreactor metagenome TaxID=1076179 RepID=A0A645A000_9ZZZZ|nr:hemolysin family protein [Oscillospiraceae bacterium]